MNVKPGDLAIIIRSRFAPENIGRIVQIVRRRDAETENTGEPQWLVRSERTLVERWADGHVLLVLERFYLDVCLRPISGVPVNDEVTDEIREPA